MSSTGPSIKNACRIVNQNSCGSGSICGEDEQGVYILTNAHVAGTKIGRTVRVDIQPCSTCPKNKPIIANNSPIQKSARVILAGYSDRTQTDWAVLLIQSWSAIDYGIRPVKLSKQKPSISKSYYTMGSPRCVWPLRNTDIVPVDMQPNMPLWRWLPNAIGGQSGSGVYSDDDDLQYGLLTWSWGGLGAGQQTAEIYKQARDSTTAGLPRVPDLIPLPDYDDAETVDRTGLDDPVVEEGLFAQSGFRDLPIWHDPSDPKPEPEPDPEPDPDTPCDPCPDPANMKDWMIEHFRRQEEFYMKERRSLEEDVPSAPKDPEAPDSEPDSEPDDPDGDCDKIFGL